MDPVLILALAGLGYYLYTTGALGTLPSRQIDPGSLMHPPRNPNPTSPTSGTSIAPGSGLGGATGIVAAVGAGIGALVYGITEKGWFRGGEEGVKVNPARDDFFSQFQQWAIANGAGQLNQQAALATVLQRFTPLDGNQQNALITAMYQADTVDRYMAAAKAIANALAPSGFPVSIPV